MTRLKTKFIQDPKDARLFFEAAARNYRDQHGDPQRLLEYRLNLIRSLIGQHEGGSMLEIGCGTGIHLFALADEFDCAIGADFSQGMVAQAETIRARHEHADKIRLAVDRAEVLASFEDETIDIVLCVGAFEHMTDKLAVLTQIRRVLKPEGIFLCLTPNGDYLWYRIADFFGIDSRHLSSDRFVNLAWLREALPKAGLSIMELGHWTFIPKGDVGATLFRILRAIDRLGSIFGLSAWRGGIYFKAGKLP